MANPPPFSTEFLFTDTSSPPPVPLTAGDKRPAPRGAAAYPRKRAVTACQVCRARRTKCDNQKPSCSFCLKVGARCVQSAVDPSSFDPASIKILAQLSELQDAVERCQSTTEAIATFLAHAGPSAPAAATWPLGQMAHVDVARLLPPSIEAICRLPVLDLAPVARGASIATGTDTGPTLSLDHLEPRLTRPLLDQFFQYVHVKNPVLDETHTRRLVTQFCAEGLDWSPESCLVLLVLALGATATPFEQPDQVQIDSASIHSARSFYKAAQKRLALTVDGPDRVLEAQCHFLCGVYAATFFQRETAWKFFLHALACCQFFRFQSPDSSPGAQIFDEVGHEPTHGQRALTREQTIYWSAWKSERELRSGMTTPDFALSQTEMVTYPQFFPTPPVNGNARFPDSGEGLHDREQHSWYFYLSEISLRRLTSCITKAIVQCGPSSPGEHYLDGLAKAACVHESQAEEWAMRLPRVISLDQSPETDDVCRFVLRGHLLDLYEIIYWPFIDALISGCPMDGERALLRSLVRKGLQKHVERLWVNQAGYKHRHHGTLLLLQMCSRSALVLVVAALVIRGHLDQQRQCEIMMPLGWREAVLLAIEMNRYWAAESVDARYLEGVVEAAWERVEGLDV
ncbi:C6 zinc finger domain protein [Aspergillus spinulosporus]